MVMRHEVFHPARGMRGAGVERGILVAVAQMGDLSRRSELGLAV
jgi:hypothetical protein